MKIELREHRARLLAHARAVDHGDRAEPTNRQIAERDILRNRERRDEAQLLGDGHDARRYRLARTGKIAWLARHDNPAAVGAVNAAKNADQGGFAGTVLADNSVDLARPDVEIDPGERNRGAELLPDCVGSYDRKIHARETITISRWSSWHEFDLHLLVGELSVRDDDVVVKRDRAVAHRNVIVSLGGALAAALRVGAGREQEIAGEAARAGVVAPRIGAIKRDRVPASLRVEAPAKMRDRVSVHVVGVRPVAFQPIAHQLGIKAAFDAADEAVANVEPDVVLHITAVGQDDDVSGPERHGPIRGALVGEGVHVAGAPVIEAAG